MISSAPDTGRFLQALFDDHGRLLSKAPFPKYGREPEATE